MKTININDIKGNRPIIGFGEEIFGVSYVLLVVINLQEEITGYRMLWVEGELSLLEEDYTFSTWQELLHNTKNWETPINAYLFNNIRDLYRHLGVNMSLEKVAKKIII